MQNFQDKVAVVTGAASGIGRALVEIFIEVGMKVVLADIDTRALDETTACLRAAGADVLAVPVDVSKSDQVDNLAKQTLSRYGAVHVLCNNAGVFVGGRASWTNPLADWHWIVAVNLMGVVHGIRAFLPVMIEQNSEAHIVNTASLGGLIASGSSLYGATKAAVVSLSENLSVELHRGGFKPRVSVLCPGLVDTNIMDSHRRRPAEFMDGKAATPELSQVRAGAAEALKKGGLSPRAVAEQTLAAIREERLFVLTHPELNRFIEQRAKDMLKGSDPAPQP